MRTFLIQSNDTNHHIPAQAYGYTAIEAIDYANWYNGEKIYDYILTTDVPFKRFYKDYLTKYQTPIGSVEYVTTWLHAMGVDSVKPLNIPKELWRFCARDVRISTLDGLTGHWMKKDLDSIKDDQNGEIFLDGSKTSNKKYFLTKWVDRICSEWRVFVFNKKIRGIRCYSGDEWILPCRFYIEDIVNAYDKKSYTLDVMVRDNGRCTDIVELHDFFACGLYGFEDFTVLPQMWISTISELSGQKHPNIMKEVDYL